MKKAATIFLIFIYAFTVTGVAVKADFCCNSLTSVKLVLADGAKDKEGCCKVKYHSLKVKDAHAAADILVAPVIHYTHIHSLNYWFKLHAANADNIISINIHPPPSLAGTPAYISNCVFKI